MTSTSLSRHRSYSDRSGGYNPVSRSKEVVDDQPFQPCAATGSIFLFAQGSTVLCLHYDTLATDRRFTKHSDDIVFISVDNVSETGAGRLVATYDARQTAIVWDILTGEQISRFASYEPLTVASWMRNGNIAFGNGKGEVILFEPSTSEHVSARTIFDPITAIAPSADCKTYAIGYNNGSILLASLQPSFTMLHTLTTNRPPSPIVSLTWHASSSKQKSDMLATQTAEGDVRVWSVSKPSFTENPRVIRVLKRSETYLPGRTWISWSKNGRIIQYAESETWAWDVRTKNVTYETIPVIDGVKGIAAHGPTGTLFTLGPDNSIQQYDVEHGQMVKNVRHTSTGTLHTPPEDGKVLPWGMSESEEDLRSPRAQSRQDSHTSEVLRNDRPQTASPQIPITGTTTRLTRKPSKARDITSPGGKTELTGTSFSLGAQLRENSAYTPQSPSSARNDKKRSRLRQEVLLNAEERPMLDMFPIIRARLSDVPYKPPRSVDETRMTPDDLRRQMLSVVFGWEGDIEDLIRDELDRHPPNSPHTVYLSKWLEEDSDTLADMMASTEFTSNVEWMLLGLSTISNHPSTKKIMQVFLERLLSRGDVHAAATLLFSVGDRSDAIEVYVSRNLFLEAVLLTCIASPQDWQRQSYLVRKWGEHVVENSQQQLAIRCFSCTGIEPADPWTSPTAQKAVRPVEEDSSESYEDARYDQSSYSDAYQSTIDRRRARDAPTPVAMPAPSTSFRTAAGHGSRITPQTSALKLITSFGSQPNQYRFPGLKSDDRTPTYGGAVTPIAESAIDRSAISPGGSGSYRLNNMRSINAALSARHATTSPYPRQRLASIGETPIDGSVTAIPFTPGPKSLPTPVDSALGDDKEKIRQAEQTRNDTKSDPSILLLSSARYEPSATPAGETPQTAFAPQTAVRFPSRSDSFAGRQSRASASDDPIPRNASRSRKPDGLQIHTEAVQEVDNEESHSSQSKTTNSYQTTQFDGTSELQSPPTTGEMYRRTRSPSVNSSNLDLYISSLDQAQRQPRPRGYSGSAMSPKEEEQQRNRQRSQTLLGYNNGRDERKTIAAAKRSPASPIPMSSEDMQLYTAGPEGFPFPTSKSVVSERAPSPDKQSKGNRRRASSLKDSKQPPRSRPKQVENNHQLSSQSFSRQSSPEAQSASHKLRGRSSSRKNGSEQLSPASPQPMVPSEEEKTGESDPAFRFVTANRHRGDRSTSRRPRDGSRRREQSNEGRRYRTRSHSRQPEEREPESTQNGSAGDRELSRQRRHRDISSHRAEKITSSSDRSQLNYQNSTGTMSPVPAANINDVLSPVDRRRKELAAAELEARRISLARRPSVPNIPFPTKALHNPPTPVPQAPLLIRSHTEELLTSARYNNNRAAPEPVRRTTTPRAMQRSENSKQVDPLPSTAYRTTNLTPVNRQDMTGYASPEQITDLPKHYAYDARIATSRSTSKNREEQIETLSRATSQDRARFSPRDNIAENLSSNAAPTHLHPPILPELQHLALPPPPPPPPPKPSHLHLRIDPDFHTASQIPLPMSAVTSNDSPASANPFGNHRRGRSGGPVEPNQLMNKIRGFTGRVTSPNRGRDNSARSPPQQEHSDGSDLSRPYETNIQGPSPQMQPHAFMI